MTEIPNFLSHRSRASCVTCPERLEMKRGGISIDKTEEISRVQICKFLLFNSADEPRQFFEL